MDALTAALARTGGTGSLAPSTSSAPLLVLLDCAGLRAQTSSGWSFEGLPKVLPFFPSSALGCTDPFAANYDPAAAANDGSCSYECDARNLRAPAETSMTVIGLERLIISSGMSVSSSL